jgi:hypothetical protein
MAWHLTVRNNFYQTIMAVGMPINVNENRPFKVGQKLGSGYINVPGVGAVNFVDIGDRQMGGHSKKKWGVVISYQGEDALFRYDGEGELNVTINEFGQAEISGNGDLMLIKIPSYVFK